VTEDFDIALRSILGQLVEAREDQNDAERRLHEYRAANIPPQIPNVFEDVDAFLHYHHRRQSYEIQLKQHQNALKKAKKEYADAAALPPSSGFSCPMECLYFTPTKASGASCLAQGT
jgi:hypothetical protein